MLDLLVQNRRADRVRPRVLELRERADVAVRPDGAPLRLDQHGEQVLQRRPGRRLAALEAVRQVGVRAAGDVGEPADVPRQLAAQLVDAGHQRLEVVAVLDPGVLDDLLQPLPLHADRRHPQDGVVVESRELRPRRRDQLLEQLLDVDAGLLDHLFGHFPHR